MLFLTGPLNQCVSRVGEMPSETAGVLQELRLNHYVSVNIYEAQKWPPEFGSLTKYLK